jgi:hypothetical protein
MRFRKLLLTVLQVTVLLLVTASQVLARGDWPNL